MTRQQDETRAFLLQRAMLDDPEFLKGIVQGVLQQFLDTEMTAQLGAAPHERSDERRGYRCGSYERTLTTRVGRITLRVPRDREGRFSTQLFARYQRSEKAFVLALLEMYVQGVSTRKVASITEELCGAEVSKSQVSSLAAGLDAELAIWRGRPVGACPYLFVDARYEKVRHQERVVSMAVQIVYGVTAEGQRTILDVSVSHSENEADYKRLFRGLKERGLTGVELVISDDHEGLKKASQACFPSVCWQRCQVHFLRNLLMRVRKPDRGWILAAMKDVFASPDKQTAHSRLSALLTRLGGPYPQITDWLEEDGPETLTVYDFPAEHRRRLRTTNNIERLNQEIKRRTRVVRIFPNEASCLRLVTALCQEQSEVWETERRYLIMEGMTANRKTS